MQVWSAESYSGVSQRNARRPDRDKYTPRPRTPALFWHHSALCCSYLDAESCAFASDSAKVSAEQAVADNKIVASVLDVLAQVHGWLAVPTPGYVADAVVRTVLQAVSRSHTPGDDARTDHHRTEDRDRYPSFGCGVPRGNNLRRCEPPLPLPAPRTHCPGLRTAAKLAA